MEVARSEQTKLCVDRLESGVQQSKSGGDGPGQLIPDADVAESDQT